LIAKARDRSTNSFFSAGSRDAIDDVLSSRFQDRDTYIIQAPPPTDSSIIPSIYWIELALDRAVEWLWTVLLDGNRVVTGYKVIPKEDSEA
jgi:hypothetical protein